MTDHDALNAAGGEPESELAWLADRFVLGELSTADERAVVDRLAADEDLAAAVARSSRLVAALRVPRTVPAQPAKATPAPRRVVVAAIAAALALVACWVGFPPVSGPPAGGGGPGEVVRLWRQADEAEWAEDEPPTEDETVDGDVVPDWMLAAVGLDATASLEPGVQEN